MSYKYETQYNSPNYKKGRSRKPDSIVIHHWGIYGQKHENVVMYLCRPNGNSSAHYVVSAGRVTCIVDPDDTAWHAGSRGNLGGIGIECRPECTQADMETVAELIADLRKTYGNIPLYPHKKYMATACPGRWADKLGWLSDRANQINAGKGKPATPAPAPAPAATPAATSFKVRVSISNLNIRKGPGTNYQRVQYIARGVYTIVETRAGQGSTKGWGKLKSGAGWISLDYTTRL